MERFKDLALVLRSFPYQERDKIIVLLTENHGKRTAIAKGAVHSKRFGGSLDFLSCSQVEIIQKPSSEMGRIESAQIHHEFRGLTLDFDKLTYASFCAEFCLKILEPNLPNREIFVLLTNVLHLLENGFREKTVLNSFLCKSFKILGYSPSLLRCVQCGLGAHEIHEKYFQEKNRYFWSSAAGGIVCVECAGGRYNQPIAEEVLLYYHHLTLTSFKNLKDEENEVIGKILFALLTDFLEHHIPGLDRNSIQSWSLLS